MKTIGMYLMGIMLSVMLFSCEDAFKNGNSGSLMSDEITLGTVKSEIVGTSTYDITSAEGHSIAMEKMGGMGIIGMGGKPGFGGIGNMGDFMGFKGHHLDECATVTQSSETYPKEIVIAYGDGCTDGRGPVKKGNIVINVTDTMANAGAVRTVTYVDFYIGDRKVEGNETVTNKGKDENGQWVIETKSNQTITHEDGTVTVRNNVSVQTWKAGFETADKSDDILYQTGSGSATIADTIAYKSEILEPLLIDRSCRSIVSGIIEITRNGSTTTLDYGDGECDSLVTVTKDGETEEIDLSECRLDGKAMRDGAMKGDKGKGQGQGGKGQGGKGQGQGGGHGN